MSSAVRNGSCFSEGEAAAPFRWRAVFDMDILMGLYQPLQCQLPFSSVNL